MLKNFLSDVKQWAAQPYNSSGSTLNWFLFIGLVLASIFLWTRVINLIIREI